MVEVEALLDVEAMEDAEAELVIVSGLGGMDFLITLVSLVLSTELEPNLNTDPRPRKSFEFRFFFRSSFC